MGHIIPVHEETLPVKMPGGEYMDREFHYSVNILSREEAELWNANHTLEEIDV